MIYPKMNVNTLQVMAKVEELNKSMGPAYKIADQVKDVKRLLDLLEAALNAKQCYTVISIDLMHIKYLVCGKISKKKLKPFLIACHKKYLLKLRENFKLIIFIISALIVPWG